MKKQCWFNGRETVYILPGCHCCCRHNNGRFIVKTIIIIMSYSQPTGVWSHVSSYSCCYVSRLWNPISAAGMKNFWTLCWIWRSLDGWRLQPQVWENSQTSSEDLSSEKMPLYFKLINTLLLQLESHDLVPFCIMRQNLINTSYA